MIFIRHFKWGKHIRVTGDEPTNDDVAYAVGLLDPHYPPPAIIHVLSTVEKRNAFYSSDKYWNMTTAEKCAVQGDGFINDYD